MAEDAWAEFYKPRYSVTIYDCNACVSTSIVAIKCLADAITDGLTGNKKLTYVTSLHTDYKKLFSIILMSYNLTMMKSRIPYSGSIEILTCLCTVYTITHHAILSLSRWVCLRLYDSATTKSAHLINHPPILWYSYCSKLFACVQPSILE